MVVPKAYLKVVSWADHLGRWKAAKWADHLVHSMVHCLVVPKAVH